MSEVLPDLLDFGLVAVFCGTAASAVSAKAGAYYANPGNRFWRTLYEIGMTSRLFAAAEFRTLLSLKIGLTDVAKNAAGSDHSLAKRDFDPEALNSKVRHFQPLILAFTSKAAGRAWQQASPNRPLQYGWQREKLGRTQIYVLPSPSGAGRRHWDIAPWQTLAKTYLQRLTQV